MTQIPHREKAAGASDALPAISVVVIGRNEGDRLVQCLRSVQGSNYPADRLEVIYVDSGSTDESCSRAAELGSEVIALRPERPCAAAGRNGGFRAASHELVHFLDGDTIVHPDWFREAVAAMADPRVACVFGRREEVAPRSTIYNFWTHHDWYVPPGEAASCAGDALFRRDALQRAGGFDETLIAGEEPDLCYRIRSEQGKIILSLDRPMTRHDMGMTRFRQYWRRCTRTGHAYAEVGGRHAGMKSWRRKRLRGPAHVGIALLSVGLSIGFRSWVPLAAWALLLGMLILRNAWRLRGQVGTLPDALRYSCHHYLSKLPIAVGTLDYWMRQAFRRSPKPLIEYRQQAGKGVHG